MPLVPAICTHCGGKLEVDNMKEAAICPYCGQAYIVEQAINYITNNNNISNTITNSTVYIANSTQMGAEKYFETCISYLRIKEYEKALASIKEARRLLPDNGKYLFYYGLVRNGEWKEYKEKYPKYQEWEIDYLKTYKNNSTYIYYFMGNANHAIDRERCKLFFSICDKCNIDSRDIFFLKGFHRYSGWRSIDDINFLMSIDKQKLINPYQKYTFFTYEGGDYYNSIYEIASGVEVRMSADISNVGYNQEIKGLIEKYYPNSDKYIKDRKTSGCYIATCVYGSYDCPEVWTLRRFRDDTLDNTWYGRLFIKGYYAISPTLVKWLGKKEWFRTFWKKNLDTMVSKLNQQGVKNTEYRDKY